jgi:hypothetical protein
MFDDEAYTAGGAGGGGAVGVVPAGSDVLVVGGRMVGGDGLALAGLLAGPVEELSADGCLTVLSWAAREKSRLDAVMLRAQAQFAAHRPPEEKDPGGAARGYSEWAGDEIAAELRMSTGTARTQLDLAVALSSRLPGTLAALETGTIDLRRARAMADVTAPLSGEQAAAVEQRVLARGGRGSHETFRRAARTAVLKVDPDGAEQRRQQQRRLRGLFYRPADDGLAELTAVLPAEHATAIYQMVTNLARHAAGPDDSRCLDERRADALVDLLLGPNREQVSTEIHVIVPVTTLMGMGDQPGELAGYGPIPAGLARELADQPTSTWRRMLIDPADGSVLEVSRRRFPSPALRRYVEARDRTCSFPGCLRPAQQCDIDHARPHGDGGATAAGNLDPACKHHHRLRHEGGWTLTQPQPGHHAWQSPENRTYHVTAEPYTDDGPPPY